MVSEQGKTREVEALEAIAGEAREGLKQGGSTCGVTRGDCGAIPSGRNGGE